LTSPRRSPPAQLDRILLVRTSALGDIVHSLPVLAALRRRYSDARIGWVVDESFAPLLAGHGLIDELVPVPLRRWRSARSGRRRLAEVLAFLSRLRRFRAQVAIDLMGNHKGALLARLSGAPVRIGARRPDRREPASSIWINSPAAVTGRHAASRAFSLLGPLGIETPTQLDFAPEALTCGADHVPDASYVYLHPGAAWGNKRYPPELWGRVATELVAAGIDTWVGAGPGEEALADRVVAASGGAAHRIEAPTLEHLAGAVRGARLVLAGDTGAVHLARALGVPVVAVHGPTDPELHGPYAAPSSVVVRRLPCSFCHQRMEIAKACLAGVDPHDIGERAQALLASATV
jgi:lipopolysaccharide heptosyltransferase I